MQTMIRPHSIVHLATMVFFRLIPLLLALFSASSFAQSPPADCSLARDPERCLIHQNALETCADLRGKQKAACLAEHIPPVDCANSKNPARCEAIERAKQACAGKSGKALKSCMSGSPPKKSGKATKSTPRQIKAKSKAQAKPAARPQPKK